MYLQQAGGSPSLAKIYAAGSITPGQQLIYTRLLQHCKPMRGVSDQTHSYASPFLFTSNNSPAFQNQVSGGMGEI